MNLLALDTATEACSVALQVGDAVISRFVVAGRSHTQELPRQVAEVLAEAGLAPTALDGVICGIGPGSFAGLRIGLSYAKGLAMVAELPMVGISSLQMMAEATPASRVLTVIDARLSAVYAAAWQRDAASEWQMRLAPTLCAPEDLPVADDDGVAWQGVGSGFAVYADALATAWQAPLIDIDASALPDARHALKPGQAILMRGDGMDASQLQPLYLRNKVALTQVEQRALRAPRQG